MNRPTKHKWDEGSTHHAVSGKEYDAVWDYVDQLEVTLERAHVQVDKWIKAAGDLQAEMTVLQNQISILTAEEQPDDPK